MSTETGYADISASAPLPTRAGSVPLRRFLLDCAAAVAGTPTDEQVAFLNAGRRALLDRQRWSQLGLALERPAPRLYAELGELATTVLDDGLATEFFFMHKPPGLRIRFEPAPGRRDDLRAALRDRVRGWQERDLVGPVGAPGYEPETALFGGPASMRHVHRLFTADSLLWLDHHADPAEPAWALSLSVLAALFAGLGVVGWEDLSLMRGRGSAISRMVPFRCLTEALMSLQRFGTVVDPADLGPYRRSSPGSSRTGVPRPTTPTGR